MNPFKRLWRKKSEFERATEPLSLNPNPLVAQEKLGLIVALPFLAAIMGLLMYVQTVGMTKEEFLITFILAMVFWVAGIAVYWALSRMQSNTHVLHDRMFGFTERLHPSYEIYCLPSDIRALIRKEDQIVNFDALEEKILALGIEKPERLIAQLKTYSTGNWPKYAYYFRQKHAYQGWNAETHTSPIFKSHVVFTDDPYDQAFIFSEGQENWWNSIPYNHSHAESDIVKVLGWSPDPFDPDNQMPWTVLIHSSVNFKRPHVEENEFKFADASTMAIASLHAQNEELRRNSEAITSLKDANLRTSKTPIELGHEAAVTDIKLFLVGMKDIPRKWFGSTWAKALVSIAVIGAILFIIFYMFDIMNVRSWFQFILRR